MSAQVVVGNASITAWDQNQAAALDKLRNSEAFILVAWPSLDDRPDITLLAKGGGAPVLLAMIESGALGLSIAADETLDLIAHEGGR